jgi:hypothetical protein
MPSTPTPDPTADDASVEPVTHDATTHGTEPTGNPVDPAIATSSPDLDQTGRERRHED